MSSFDDYSAIEHDTTYMTNYLKNILTPEIFKEFQTARQKNVPILKMIDIPPDLKRPFQISQDYSDLIVDLINELLESDDLVHTSYDKYIAKLNDMFYDSRESKFKENSPNMIIEQYKNIFEKNCRNDCIEFIFSKSDSILKEQVYSVLNVNYEKSKDVSDLETFVINFDGKLGSSPNSPVIKKMSPGKNSTGCPAPPAVPPPPPPSDSDSPPDSPNQQKSNASSRSPPSSCPKPPAVPPPPPPSDSESPPESPRQQEANKASLQYSSSSCPKPPDVPPPPPPSDSDSPPESPRRQETNEESLQYSSSSCPKPPAVPPPPPPSDSDSPPESPRRQEANEELLQYSSSSCPKPPDVPPPPPPSDSDSQPESPRQQETNEESLQFSSSSFSKPAVPPQQESDSQILEDSSNFMNSSQELNDISFDLDSPHKSPPQSPYIETPPESPTKSLSGDISYSPMQSQNESLDIQSGIDDDQADIDDDQADIDEDQLRDRIYQILTLDLFNKMIETQKSGKLTEVIPNPDDDEIIDFISFQCQMDTLSDFTYEDYVEHLIDSFFDNMENDDYANDIAMITQ